MYVGVELLYKHAGTPLGFLTKRSPTLRANKPGRGVSGVPNELPKSQTFSTKSFWEFTSQNQTLLGTEGRE